MWTDIAAESVSSGTVNVVYVDRVSLFVPPDVEWYLDVCPCVDDALSGASVLGGASYG